MNDPPAADLAPLTPELRAWLVAHANGTDSPSLRAGIPAALDLIDAQAARLAAYDERERIAATLDCKIPKCPRSRAVILTGPQPEPRYGTPGLFLVWWCSSCGTQWSHWERAGAVGAGEA